MSITKFGIFVLLISSIQLSACKGEIKSASEKAGDLVSEAKSEVGGAMSEAADAMGDVAEAVEEVKDDVVEVISDVADEGKSIVAPNPPSNTKPETQNTVPKPKAQDVGNTKPTPKADTEIVSTPSTSTNTTTKPSTKPSPTNSGTVTKPSGKNGNVLKEVEKPSSAPKEKVNPGTISKPSASTSTTTTKMENTKQGFSHAGFDQLLKKVVSSTGVVDYALLKTNAAELDAYCKMLEGNAPEGSWNKNQKLAYWLNAYNAYTLKLIVENYPLKSITDLDGGKPWDKKWINLDGKTLSLNDIENVIIRPTFKDARIHFAVNCAAKSCPPLANYAFTGRNVDAKMDALAKSFINSSSNEISADKIVVSKIFDWYGDDFPDLIGFINKYSNTTVDASAKVRYKEYDWALNGK